MKIEKTLLNGVEIPTEEAKLLVQKHVNTHIAMECFLGGIAIQTPEGTLQAEISFS